MGAATETGVVGVFAHVDAAVRAIEQLRAKGHADLTAYTPAPIHEIEEVLERGRPVSRVRLFTLIGGLTGTTSGFLLTIWSAMQWGLVTGGKPIASIPPFVIIAFELTILFGGIATFLGLAFLSRLPRVTSSPWFDPRFTNDRFGVAVRCTPDRRDGVRAILQAAGADEVRAV